MGRHFTADLVAANVLHHQLERTTNAGVCTVPRAKAAVFHVDLCVIASCPRHDDTRRSLNQY